MKNIEDMTVEEMEDFVKKYREDPLYRTREMLQKELDNIDVVTVNNGDGSYSIELVVRYKEE